MSGMFDLKPCPFCGGKAHLFVDNGVHVFCQDCGATSKILADMRTARGVSGCAVESVIEAWNTRKTNSDALKIQQDNAFCFESIPRDKINETIYECIERILREKKISRRQLAIQSGIPVSSLNSMFSRKSPFSVETLKCICDLLGLNITLSMSKKEEGDCGSKMTEEGKEP